MAACAYGLFVSDWSRATEHARIDAATHMSIAQAEANAAVQVAGHTAQAQAVQATANTGHAAAGGADRGGRAVGRGGTGRNSSANCGAAAGAAEGEAGVNLVELFAFSWWPPPCSPPPRR